MVPCLVRRFLYAFWHRTTLPPQNRNPVSPFLATHPKNAPLSPLLATHPKNASVSPLVATHFLIFNFSSIRVRALPGAGSTWSLPKIRACQAAGTAAAYHQKAPHFPR